MPDRLGPLRHPAPWFGLGVFLSWLARCFVFDAGVRAELGRVNPAVTLMKIFFSMMMAAIASGLFAPWLQWRLRTRPPAGWPNPGMPALLGFMHSWIFLELAYLYVIAGPVPALASQLLAGAVLGGLPIALAEVTLLICMSRRF